MPQRANKRKSKLKQLLKQIEEEQKIWRKILQQHEFPNNQPKNEFFRNLPGTNLQRLEEMRQQILQQLKVGGDKQ